VLEYFEGYCTTYCWVGNIFVERGDIQPSLSYDPYHGPYVWCLYSQKWCL